MFNPFWSPFNFGLFPFGDPFWSPFNFDLFPFGDLFWSPLLVDSAKADEKSEREKSRDEGGVNCTRDVKSVEFAQRR